MVVQAGDATAAAADAVTGAMEGALPAAVRTAGSSVRDVLAAGVLEQAAANVAKATEAILLTSNGIRHHGCPAKSGPEGPLRRPNVTALEFRSKRDE